MNSMEDPKDSDDQRDMWVNKRNSRNLSLNLDLKGSMARFPRIPFDRSYWVVPDTFLAGAYPRSHDRKETLARITGLVECGIRFVVSLMEEDERNFRGEQFEPYEDLLARAASALGVEIRLKRMPIRDLHIPSRHHMVEILNTIDRVIENGQPVYVHCWGGVGRTGTVVGCYLARHGLACGSEVIDRIAFLRRDELTARRPSPETSEQRFMVQAWRPGQ